MSDNSDSNPRELNILYMILRILQLGIQLIFVFDGEDRPAKRGREPFITEDRRLRLVWQMLGRLGVPHWKAPGEAEAECAKMENLGLVDAVWAEDGDAFMFGSEFLIKFYYDNGGKKSQTDIKVFRSEKIQENRPHLDKTGFVLHAVLSGGDYNQTGLKGIGLEGCLKAAEKGLGKSLCEATETNLPKWKDELVAYLDGSRSRVKVPRDFPNFQTLEDYRFPLVSSSQDLERSIPALWSLPINEEGLQDLLIDKFGFDAKGYVEHVLPVIVVRALVTDMTRKREVPAGSEREGAAKELGVYIPPTNPRKKKLRYLVEAKFLVERATRLGLASWMKVVKEKEKSFVVCAKGTEGTPKSLGCIIEPAVAMKNFSAFILRSALDETSGNVTKKRKDALNLGSTAKRQKSDGGNTSTLDKFFKPQLLTPATEGSQQPLAASGQKAKTAQKSKRSPKSSQRTSKPPAKCFPQQTTKHQVLPPSSQPK
jgi:holliday junction resolvase YEN1